MRLLWRRYGRDFYRGRPAGLAEDALPTLIREATGVDARRFIARHAHGTADVPLAEMLAPHGISLTWQAGANIPTLDVRTRKQGEALALATVYEAARPTRAACRRATCWWPSTACASMRRPAWTCCCRSTTPATG